MFMEALLAVYFPLNIVLFLWGGYGLQWMPCAMLAASVFSMIWRGKMHSRLHVAILTAQVFIWCWWYIDTFGWGCGAQHLLLPLLILCFFNITEWPLVKCAYFLILIGYRMILYSRSLNHVPICQLSTQASITYQTVNSLTLFFLTACLCILFSTNIQDTERQLRIDNQELHKEAGTDPLTQLPNRRAMIEQITKYVKKNPESPYCVAIADIDHFKMINDTYGHNCGDYTLVKLTELFKQASNGRYLPCRWGGEEFCFFMADMNLDEGGLLMNDLCISVQGMQLQFEDHNFRITITIGVEENDFVSSLDSLLNSADRKLYMGKEAGRNRVVV